MAALYYYFIFYANEPGLTCAPIALARLGASYTPPGSLFGLALPDIEFWLPADLTGLLA